MNEQRTQTAGGLARAWQALGSLIGAHLMLVVPAGVALGIAFPELLLPVKPFIPLLFAIMTFQNSLGNDLKSIKQALRSPLTLAAILLMVHVAMPLLTFGVSSLLFGSDSHTVAGPSHIPLPVTSARLPSPPVSCRLAEVPAGGRIDVSFGFGVSGCQTRVFQSGRGDKRKGRS